MSSLLDFFTSKSILICQISYTVIGIASYCPMIVEVEKRKMPDIMPDTKGLFFYLNNVQTGELHYSFYYSLEYM